MTMRTIFSSSSLAQWLTPRRAKALATRLMLLYHGWVVLVVVAFTRTGRAVGDAVGHDFAAFYTAGRFFLEGRLRDLYDFGAQQAFQAGLLAPQPSETFTNFVNPPHTVLLFAPFALAGYEVGLLLWWAAGLAAMAAAVSWLRRDYLPAAAPQARWLFVQAFLFYPTLAVVLYGQATAFSLLIFVAVFVLLRRREDFKAGLVLGLLAFKPQLAVGYGLVLLFKGRWRALAGAALTAGAALALALLLSPAALADYVRLSPHLPDLLRGGADPLWQRARPYPTWGIHSMFGFATLLLDGLSPALADFLAVSLTVTGAGVLLWWWRHTAWQPGTRTWDMVLAASLALGLLLSPQLYIYDVMLLLLPVALVWKHYPTGTAGRWLDGGRLLTATALVWLGTFVGHFLTLAQVEATTGAGWPRTAWQFGTLAVAWWAVAAWQAAQAREPEASAEVVHTSVRPFRITQRSRWLLWLGRLRAFKL